METEKLANYFGETVKSKKEKEMILEKEMEKREKRQKVGEMVKRWEKEKSHEAVPTSPGKRRKRVGNYRDSDKLYGPGGEVRQYGGADGEVRGGGEIKKCRLVTGSAKVQPQLTKNNI